MTIKQAVLNVAVLDFALRLSYVAMLRVKGLDRLMFDKPFDYERFRLRTKLGTVAQIRKDDAKRRKN